jgi:hypothetical protein
MSGRFVPQGLALPLRRIPAVQRGQRNQQEGGHQ